MKFEKIIKSYLTGETFSNGVKVSISKSEKRILSRLEILEEFINGKSVLHIGCCDHIPLIENKIKNGLWLHSRLTEVSEKCLGIDIATDGIDYLKNKLNYDNVICANILSDTISEITNNRWDYIVLGEILEHTDDPIDFVKTLKKKYSNYVGKIIITVPNAFSLVNFKAIKLHSEIINSDHRYWFTPYTLAKILTISDFDVTDFYFCQEVTLKYNWKAKLKFRNQLKKWKLKKYPAMRDTIVMVANF